MANILYPDESYQIIGACLADYNDKGCGLLEPVYRECLAMEFRFQKLPFVEHPEIMLRYRDQPLLQKYCPDFICFETILLEIKAVAALADAHRAQVINYLHATGKRLGILINFGNSTGLKYERFVLGDLRRTGVKQSLE